MATKPKARADEARIADIARMAGVDAGRAGALAAKARADGLRAPIIHRLVGHDLKRAGAFDAAIAEFALGLELAPTDATLICAVGFCLIELGRRQEAAQVFRAAITADPRSAEASFGYGWAAERLGALPSAKSAFERAVALDAGHADALAGLSGLAARRRNWNEARDFAERAAAIDPTQTDALMNLARVDIGQGDFDAAAKRLRAIIDLPFLKPGARADAWLMLGDALDGAHRYAEAWRAYAEGKGQQRERFAAEFSGPRVRTAPKAVRAILSEFKETPAEAWRVRRGDGSNAGERGHAFLMGFARSGTTLLEQVLASHAEASVLGEAPLLLKAEAEFLTGAGGLSRLAGVMPDMLEPYRDAYWSAARQFGADPVGKVFVDKQPFAGIRLPLIHKVFPAAKAIFIIRDPRDVALSCFRRSFTINPATFEFTTLASAAAYYDVVMEATKTYLDRLDIDVFRLKYEDLTARFEPTVRALCDFLGLAWSDSLHRFADSAGERAIATPSSTQVGRGLYEGGAGQWRNYDFALGEAMPFLTRWIETFDYPPA